MSGQERIRVYAPGSVGNVGPGLDILGMAIAGMGDEVILERVPGKTLTVIEPGDFTLPSDPTKHTAAIAANAVFLRAGISPGVNLTMRKGLALSGGQGGSAASAVAGAVAANLLYQCGLDTNTLLECALTAERIISGSHADNLAPSLLGGLVLVRSLEPVDLVSLPVPTGLTLVVVRPEQQLRTSEARAVLPKEVPLAIALHQAAQTAAMVAGACLNNLALFGRSIDDRIAEPARAPLLPGFSVAKGAAMKAGAIGCSISGAGPTIFAIAASAETGQVILDAMITAFGALDIRAAGRVTSVDPLGARVLP